MTVKWLCPDGVVRKFLLDTGAAASLVPYKAVCKACTKIGLRPSRLRLRAANGETMPSNGTGTLQLRLPNTPVNEPPTISHEFEVLLACAMPSHLQILGVDFWDRLKPDLKWGSRMVECTSPSTGKKFQMPFEIGHEDANINHISKKEQPMKA